MVDPTAKAIVNPLNLLLPYQKRWVADKSLYRIGLMTRQGGKSTMVACDYTLQSITKQKALFLLLSAGERQAKELLLKCKQWAEAFKIATPPKYRDLVAYSANSSEVSFANGSRILALPASPSTLRGYTADGICLDEFALVQDDKAIWQAVLPSITNEITGKKSVSVISTPTGLETVFAHIWANDDGTWSKHRLTIYDAVNQGLQADPEQLKKLIDDELIFQTEYCCQFAASADCAFPADWLQNIGENECPRGTYYFGYDVGRSRDISVGIVLAKHGSKLHVVDMQTYRNMPYRLQIDAIKETFSRFPITGGYIDATGIGNMLAEEIHREFPKVMPFIFTYATKGEAYDRLRKSFQNRAICVYENFVRQLVDDLGGVKRMISSVGRISYTAPHTKDGHSDASSALALAVQAEHDFPECAAEPFSWLPTSQFGAARSALFS